MWGHVPPENVGISDSENTCEAFLMWADSQRLYILRGLSPPCFESVCVGGGVVILTLYTGKVVTQALILIGTEIT